MAPATFTYDDYGSGDASVTGIDQLNDGAVVIPDTVPSGVPVHAGKVIGDIDNYAFDGETRINTVDISNALGLLYIGEYAFNLCSGITAINLNNGALNTISQYAFYDAFAGGSFVLHIPDSVAYIQNNAFRIRIE